MTTRLALGLVLCTVGCQQDIPPKPAALAAVVAPRPTPPPPKPPAPPIVPSVVPPPLPPGVHHVEHPVPVNRVVKWFRSLPHDEREVVAKVCKLRADDPCAIIRNWSDDHPNPEVALLASLPDDDKRDGAESYCEYANRHARHCNTPLVFSLDSAPIALAAATAIPFAFQPNDRVTSAWPTAATPWIAMDRDGDGAITSGAELFGDATRLADGTIAHDGYSALAALDSDGNGVIDANDPAFASLLLWSDVNGDRKSSRDELRPLSSVVTSIPIAHRDDARCDAQGNCEGERGIAHYRDLSGTDHVGAVVDLYLATTPALNHSSGM